MFDSSKNPHRPYSGVPFQPQGPYKGGDEDHYGVHGYGAKEHNFGNEGPKIGGGHDLGYGGGGHGYGYGGSGHDLGHGGGGHNLGEKETTIIEQIVTTIKNIINQQPTEKPVDDGDILNQGDMGAFTEAVGIGNVEENIKSITESVNNGNLDENINNVFDIDAGNGVSKVEEAVTKAAETFTSAIETTTKYVKEIINPESEKDDYDDGIMSAHHSDENDTLYIVLGVILGILVLVGVILAIIYWYHRRRGFHDLEGDNTVTVQKAKEPGMSKIEHSVCKEDTWLKASKGGKK